MRKVMLFLLLSLFAVFSWDSVYAQHREEISEINFKGDTLSVVSGDIFLYYPFGVLNSSEDLQNMFPNLTKTVFTDHNLELIRLYDGRDKIIVREGDDSSWYQYKMELIHLNLNTENIVMQFGIKVGLTLKELFNIFQIDTTIQVKAENIKVFEAITVLDGLFWHFEISEGKVARISTTDSFIFNSTKY